MAIKKGRPRRPLHVYMNLLAQTTVKGMSFFVNERKRLA